MCIRMAGGLVCDKLPIPRRALSPIAFRRQSPLLSLSSSIILSPAINCVHLVPRFSQDDDTLGSMAMVSLTVFVNLQLFEQIAVLARTGGLFLCMSVAVLLVAAGRLTCSLRIANHSGAIPPYIYTVLTSYCQIRVLYRRWLPPCCPLLPLCCLFMALFCHLPFSQAHRLTLPRFSMPLLLTNHCARTSKRLDILCQRGRKFRCRRAAVVKFLTAHQPASS